MIFHSRGQTFSLVYRLKLAKGKLQNKCNYKQCLLLNIDDKCYLMKKAAQSVY
jgi:recombinational DNA repair ATPase RecF